MKKLFIIGFAVLYATLAFANITPLPDPPQRTDPANFADKADAFLGALPAFATEANTLATDVNGYKTDAETAQAAAEAAQAVAQTSANFKGNWSDQTGAAAIPYSVYHEGNYWQLVSNLADVTASEPGVTVAWKVIGGVILADDLDQLQGFSVVDGAVVYLKGRTATGDGGQGVFVGKSGDYTTQVTAMDTLSGIYVPSDADPTGTSGCWIRQNASPISPLWFGENTSATAQAAIDMAHITGGAVRLSGSPVWTSTVSFPTDGQGIRLYADQRTRVSCAHNGDCIDLSSLNANYGGHIIENIWFKGPNTQYPPVGYVPTSTGSGINIETGYDNTFINVKSTGFQNGIYINKGFNNKCVGDCAFLFNQIGVLIEGGATNLNRFDGARIRLNRIGGVFINGDTSGVIPTGNSFIGAYIETNIPFFGDYASGGPGDGSTSFGVKLYHTADNDFSGTYFENHEYDVWIGESAQGNKFYKTRHAWGTGRYAKIMFDGVSCNENRFNGSVMVSTDATTPSIESNNASQYHNSFVDCTGFNIIPASITADIFIDRNSPFLRVYGTPDGVISYPETGYYNNPSEGTGRGRIDGVGTATATLNVSGLSEVVFGNGITGDTTITTITGTKKRQILTIWNYQEGHNVVLKSGGKTDNIVLNGLRDIVFSKYGQSATFLVNGFGRLVAIGRNFSDEYSGTVAISDTDTTATATFPRTEPDYSYAAVVTATTADGTPALGSRRAYISNKGLSSMTIAVEAAPGVGNTVYIDWVAMRRF